MADDRKEKYINPYTDFGFKKLFGTEMNKDLLISFLNALFNGTVKEIEDVQYLNGENLGDGYGDRRSVFDVYCSAKDGSRFIVEMQKAEQTYFKDRSVYYAATPIRQQAPKALQDRVFDKLFRQAEIAKYSDIERRQYETSLKEYWDYTSTLETAERKGEKNGQIDTARKMKVDGMAVELIVKYTGLTVEEINGL